MADRAKTIELNDRLRTTFQGGEVRVSPSVYDLDARLCGRALWLLSRLTATSPDHDCGSFVFAGYVFEWWIEDRRDEARVSPDRADADGTLRILTLQAVDDLLVRQAARRGSGIDPLTQSQQPSPSSPVAAG